MIRELDELAKRLGIETTSSYRTWMNWIAACPDLGAIRLAAAESQRETLERASNEGRNVLPDATDDQAAVIEAWATQIIEPELAVLEGAMEITGYDSLLAGRISGIRWALLKARAALKEQPR